MTQTIEWDALTQFLTDKENILITTHRNPDGDAIGSQVALAHYLQQLHKNVHLINCDHIPKFLQFLDPDHRILVFEAQQHDSLLQTLDGAVIVDISDWKRLLDVGDRIKKYSLPVACIDHHIPTDEMGEVQISDQTASSTGEMLYDYFTFVNADMDRNIVNAIYTSILTDTGSFRFSNTTPRAHRVTAELLEKGAEFRKIYELIYENNSKGRMKLKGHLLANMNFECSDRMAWFVLSQELLQQSGAEIWETEGFSELPRTIEGVEISIMFMETPDGLTKVSFRSKGHIPINGLANSFDGGGHKYASGALIHKSLAEAVPLVLGKARLLMAKHRAC